MIWGVEEIKKNLGGPYPGKNTSQKAFPRKKKFSKGIPAECLSIFPPGPHQFINGRPLTLTE